MQLNDLPYDVFQYTTKKFQITITEEEIKNFSSIDELAVHIAEKVKKNRSGFSNAFLFEKEILKQINSHFDAHFSLQDHPEKVIPKTNRKKVWNDLKEAINYDLPVLVLPKTMNTLLSFVAALLTLGTLLFSTITVGLDIFSGWIYLSALAGVILAFLLYSSIGNMKTSIKADSMSDFIKGIFLLNHKKIEKTAFLPDDKKLQQEIKEALLEAFDEKELNERVFK